jgi:hypothetical protein
MKKNFFIKYLPVFALLAFALPVFAFAASPATISINPNLPGVYNVSTSGPCGWIVDFYNFALIVAGILAFGAVVYGGVLYAISAGNASKQSEGRSWILSALIGILLLAGAYLILYTINPGLTQCSLPGLSTLANTATTGGSTPIGGGGPIGGTTPISGTCASGRCQALPNCTKSSRVNCGGAQGMVDTLSCINQLDPNGFTVSEGYPPTDMDASHLVGGHSNGCAVDVQVPNTGAGTCANVAALMNAETQCGVSNVANNNEYYNCPGGHKYGQTTGQNVHINAKKGDGGC